MQAAKQMVLIDERLIESLQKCQDSSWKKPTDQVAKSKLNRSMKTDLEEKDIPEDIKLKKYNQDLTRFLHTKRKLPEESTPRVVVDANDVAVVDSAIGKSVKKSSKKRASKKELSLSSVKTRRVKRLIKTPKKFSWDHW